jgi:hypothetical protein
MIDMTLTRFVDFALKTGAPRYTSLRETKRQIAKGYSPASDYYKQIREAIVAHHKDGAPISQFDAVAQNVDVPSKKENYAAIAAGYKSFLGRREMAWFPPPQGVWVSSGLRVSLNPELGLVIKDVSHVVKLYFKQQEPRKLEVKAILALMDAELQDAASRFRMGLLDVRRGKLITDVPTDPGLIALMQGEAAAIAAIWPSLG